MLHNLNLRQSYSPLTIVISPPPHHRSLICKPLGVATALFLRGHLNSGTSSIDQPYYTKNYRSFSKRCLCWIQQKLTIICDLAVPVLLAVLFANSRGFSRGLTVKDIIGLKDLSILHMEHLLHDIYTGSVRDLLQHDKHKSNRTKAPGQNLAEQIF